MRDAKRTPDNNDKEEMAENISNTNGTPPPASSIDCTICTSTIGQPRDDGSVEALVTLPCSHAFGMRCLAHAIADRGTCPICRDAIPLDIVRDLYRIGRGLEGSATGDRVNEQVRRRRGLDWRELDRREAERDAESFNVRERRREREGRSVFDDEDRERGNEHDLPDWRRNTHGIPDPSRRDGRWERDGVAYRYDPVSGTWNPSGDSAPPANDDEISPRTVRSGTALTSATSLRRDRNEERYDSLDDIPPRRGQAIAPDGTRYRFDQNRREWVPLESDSEIRGSPVTSPRRDRNEERYDSLDDIPPRRGHVIGPDGRQYRWNINRREWVPVSSTNEARRSLIASPTRRRPLPSGRPAEFDSMENVPRQRGILTGPDGRRYHYDERVGDWVPFNVEMRTPRPRAHSPPPPTSPPRREPSQRYRAPPPPATSRRISPPPAASSPRTRRTRNESADYEERERERRYPGTVTVRRDGRGNEIMEGVRHVGSLSLAEREEIAEARERYRRRRGTREERMEEALGDREYFRRGDRYLGGGRRDGY